MTYCSQLRKDNLLYILTKNDDEYRLKIAAFDDDIEDPLIRTSSVLYLPGPDVAVCVNGPFYHFDVLPPGGPPLKMIECDDMEVFLWGNLLVHLQYKCAFEMDLEDDENISRELERFLLKNELMWYE